MDRLYAIEMLTRIAGRRGRAGFLIDAVAARPDRLPECFEAAECDPMPDMDTILGGIVSGWPPALACALHNRLPEHTNRLRQTCLVITTACLRLLQTRAAEIPHSTLPLTEIGNNLVARLAELGRHREAVEQADALVEHLRPIVGQAPEYPRYLARSLASRAMALAAVGQTEQAITDSEEAAAILRGLGIGTDPEIDLELGLVLNNLAGQYHRAGRNQEALTAAQKSVDIHRVHRDRDPGPEREPRRNRANLAAALGVLANISVNIGDLEAADRVAREAAEILDPLAEEHPARFLHQRAMARANLAMTTQRLGNWQAAVDQLRSAAEDFRYLAHAYPDAFLTDYASVHHSLAVGLHRLGDPADALTASATAFDCLRRAAPSDPKGLAALQRALNLHLMLEPCRHLGPAGLEQIRSMAAALLEHAGEARIGLLGTLIETGKSLSDQEHPEEGLALIRAAADCARTLAEVPGSDDARTLLCSALVQSLSIQARLPRPDGIEKTVDEATQALATQARGGSSACGNAALLLNNLSNALSWLDLPRQAEAAARQAIELLRPLSEQDPARFEPQLAIALYNLARRLTGRAPSEDVAALLAKSRRRLAPYAARDPEGYGAWMKEINDFGQSR